MCFVVCYFLKLDYFSIVLFVYFNMRLLATAGTVKFAQLLVTYCKVNC